VLVNLLVNAHKYMPPNGNAGVKVCLEEKSVLIAIKDNGPGIPKDEQAPIFNRYYRRPIHEQSLEATGSGLGLPIARQLVELHGGQLWVESAVGSGSTFYIKLPLSKD
jgi:signal transduction histidine kinase